MNNDNYIQQLLRKVYIKKEILNYEESKSIFQAIFDQSISPEQITNFLSVLFFRGETPEELNAFVDCAMENAQILHAPKKKHVIDIVGTGGDGGNTFNISSASAIVMSASGCCVAKHGNKAVTGTTGSADAMSMLGVSAPMSLENKEKILEQLNLVFLYAPDFHPSFAKVGPLRRNIKMPTLFNLLGPLLNPAQVKHIVLGTPFQEKMKIIAEVLALQHYKKAVVVRSQDGLDEVSPSALCDMYLVENGQVSCNTYDPQDFGFKKANVADLTVSSKEESVKIIEEIIANKRKDACLDAVLLNAGLGVFVAHMAESWEKGIHIARETIVSGKAERHLNDVKKFISNHTE